MPEWGNCIKKRKAREESIIKWSKRLPAPITEYWTLGGDMTKKGYLTPSCELIHITMSDIVHPGIFHSVDQDKVVIDSNKQAIQNTKYDEAKFFHGNFVEILEEKMNYDSGVIIVNFDSVCNPKRGKSDFYRIINILNHKPGTSLLVWNFIYEETSYRRRDVFYDDEFKRLLQEEEFIYLKKSGNWSYGPELIGWKLKDTYHVYNGTGGPHYHMYSFPMFRNFK